jgi:hypothetical protein
VVAPKAKGLKERGRKMTPRRDFDGMGIGVHGTGDQKNTQIYSDVLRRSEFGADFEDVTVAGTGRET